MGERRRIERTNLIHYLRIFDRETNEAVGNLVDINPGGIKIVCETPLEGNQDYAFRMDFPEELDGKTLLEFDATSVWAGEDEMYPGLYVIGFRLMEIEAEDIGIIEYLIEQYRD